MADEPIAFLIQAELPTFCYVSEAVEWIALGRVPQSHWDVDVESCVQIEQRFNWREMPDNFEPPIIYPWFDRSEFEFLGFPVVEGYFAAAQRCFEEGIPPKLIQEYDRKEDIFYQNDDGVTVNIYKSLADGHRRKLAELQPLQDIVDRTEAQFWRFYEIAWSKLFQLLAAGDVICSAIDLGKWEQLCDEDMREKTQFENLDATLIPLTFDWKQNQLDALGKVWVSMRVQTKDIIRHRNLLLPQGQIVSVEKVGAGFVLRACMAHPPRRKRGRPSEVDWVKLKQHLEQLVEQGQVPETKESCIYSLITFLEKAQGRSPSRSSVQRNLHRELHLVYGPK